MTPWTPASSTGVDACCTMATGTTRCEPACARGPRSDSSRIADAAAIRRSPSDSRFSAIQVDAIAVPAVGAPLRNAGPRSRIVELPHGRDELPRVVGLAQDELDHAVALVVVHFAVRPDWL